MSLKTFWFMKTIKELGNEILSSYVWYIGFSKPKKRFAYFDLAIITMKSRVRFTDNISPLCLPSNTMQQYVGYIATVAGWGLTNQEFNKSVTRLSPVLRRVNLEILNETTCKEIERTDTEPSPFARNNFTMTK